MSKTRKKRLKSYSECEVKNDRQSCKCKGKGKGVPRQIEVAQGVPVG